MIKNDKKTGNQETETRRITFANNRTEEKGRGAAEELDNSIAA